MAKFSRKVEIEGWKKQDLFEKVAGGINRFAEKSNIGNATITKDQKDHTVTLKSSMADAELKCLDGCIELSVNLSFLATPFKGKLNSAIDQWLSKTFGI